MSLNVTNAVMARVESSFRQLASAAQALNTASEELGKVVRHLDASLKKLGLGVSAWVPVSGTSDEIQYFTTELGYAQIDGKWGLALREVTGFHLDKNDVSEQLYPYNDAPRKQRAEAIDKIPDLLEKLLQQTQETTRDLKQKIEEASDFNSIVSSLTPSSTPAAPQQFYRPEVNAAPTQSAPQPPARPLAAATPLPREPQQLPAERLPQERPVAANAAPQPVARFREEERPSGSAPVAVRAVPTARVL